MTKTSFGLHIFHVITAKRLWKLYFTFFGLLLFSYILKWLSLQCIFKGTAMCFKGWCCGEKRTMKFGIPRVWREPTNQPHKRLLLFVWLIHPDVEPEKMLLPLNIRIFLLRLLQLFILISFPRPIPPSTYHQLSAGESTSEDDNIQNDEYTLNPEL